MENENKEVVIVKIYSGYTEAQKKAIKKYRENNIDKVREMSRVYINERRRSDPEFRQKAREYQQAYYRKKRTERCLEYEREQAEKKEAEEKKKKTEDMVAYRKEYYKNHMEKVQCPNCLLQILKPALGVHQKSKKCQIITSIRKTYTDN